MILTKDSLQPNRFRLPLDEEEVDWNAGHEKGEVDADELRRHEDGERDQEEANDQKADGQQEIDLNAKNKTSNIEDVIFSL